MKERLGNIINSADLRPSEVLGMTGATGAITSAIFLGRFEWSGDIVLFSSIFAVTAVARDVGCRTIKEISDKIAWRKGSRETTSVAPDDTESEIIFSLGD